MTDSFLVKKLAIGLAILVVGVIIVVLVAFCAEWGWERFCRIFHEVHRWIGGDSSLLTR